MEFRAHHLFVVDRDAAQRDALSGYLHRQGYAVTTMASAEALMQQVARLRPDLVLLDVVLPGATGLQACQRLRAAGNPVPIILLSALCDEVDRVIGLEVGADDFVGKPVSERELHARIRALLRRAGGVVAGPAGHAAPVTIGRLSYHPAARVLAGAEGRSRVLSALEHALLTELLSNPGTALSRERLLAASRRRPGQLLPRTVDVAIMRLRRLVEPDPAEPRYIRTARGLGYLYLPEGEAAPAAADERHTDARRAAPERGLRPRCPAPESAWPAR